MATSNTISPDIVGHMFVEQYYHLLHHSPEVVFKFYQGSSVLTRPNSDGSMTTATTMHGINEKILSIGYEDYKSEIKSADAQNSFGNGVIVLVTGSLTGIDNMKRNFTQTFFLAPQDNGYFVLNDVFRYVEGADSLKTDPVNLTDDHPVQLATLPEPAQVVDSPATVPAVSSEHNAIVVEKTHESVDSSEVKAIESSVAVDKLSDSKTNSISVFGEIFTSSISEDSPKKSYASIVSSESKMSNSHGRKTTASRQEQVYVPANTSKATPKMAPKKIEKEALNSVDHLSVLEAPDAIAVAAEDDSQHEEAEGHSIYIRNLPYEATVTQVGAAFEKFGPIKAGGIQVRCHKDVGHCFGFVEFQFVDSMIKAVEASLVNVGGRQVIVETKKTTSRAGMGRRIFEGRNSFQHENPRGRGNFNGGVGGRPYNRNEYGLRGDFFAQNTRLPFSRGGGYHRGRGGKFSQSNGQYQNQVLIPA